MNKNRNTSKYINQSINIYLKLYQCLYLYQYIHPHISIHINVLTITLKIRKPSSERNYIRRILIHAHKHKTQSDAKKKI